MDRAGLREQFEELLYREAWLLDHDHLEEWLELLSRQHSLLGAGAGRHEPRPRGPQSATAAGIFR